MYFYKRNLFLDDKYLIPKSIQLLLTTTEKDTFYKTPNIIFLEEQK